MASRVLRWLAVVLALLLASAAAQAAWLWQAAREAPQHLARKGQLVDATPLTAYQLHNDTVREFRLQSDSGLAVDIAIRYPAQGLEHRPLLLVMGGQETGRAAVDVIPDTRGAMVAAITYPFGTVPHRSLLQVFLALPRIQQGIFNTPAAALLALEYLLSDEAGLDPGQVELAGISFGAYLAPVPAALDPRIERLWLIHGGGAAAQVLDYGLEKRLPVNGVRRAAAGFLAAVAGAAHLGPERWVARMSPRPTVLVHATRESALPPVAVEALEAAVYPPVEVLYTEGKHVHPKRPEVVAAISDLMFERMR